MELPDEGGRAFCVGRVIIALSQGLDRIASGATGKENSARSILIPDADENQRQSENLS